MTEESLFAAALELAPADREAFLDRECSNQELRQQVARLLRLMGGAGQFLERPAVAGPVAEAELPATAAATTAEAGGPCEPLTVDATGGPRPLTEGPGTRVGPYKLLQKIGEGGMGSVYMAEQEQPVRRKVALKIIKPGMESDPVLARFEAERQALALMDHPNIARVFDAGVTDTGRPYFAMELIKGIPITEYCDQNRLTPRQRLEMFVPVCQAIQHAHQKGVIHRDVKPSNVLVTLYDGKPVPKVIDFGVAKAVEQRLTERTLFTQFGAIVGTLEYMSPEQAELSALDVDTRSDVYSLGVLLYELLTGTTPLERERLRQSAYGEILRRIKQEEPPKPSTRLSSSGDRLASIAATRGTDPARLTRAVRGDLDWVVMKALEKDRTRRYESANGFARDVERYLEGDPVEAGPPSAAYRLRKLASKHRAGLATVGAFALLLVAAAGVSIALAVRATRAERKAAAALQVADSQRRLAEERSRLARHAVDEMYTEFADNVLAVQPGMNLVQRRFLEKALGFYEGFVREQGDEPEVRYAVASAYQRMVSIHSQLGQGARAEASIRRAVELLDGLVTDFPSVTKYRALLAECYNIMGEIGRDPREKEQAYRKSLLHWEAQAEEPAARARSLRHQRTALYNLAMLLLSTHRLPEAEQCMRRFMALTRTQRKEYPHYSDHSLIPADDAGKNPSDLEDAAWVWAAILRQTGRPEEAERVYRDALDWMEQDERRLAAAGHPVADYARKIQELLNTEFGTLLAERGRTREAEMAFRRALELDERLMADHPAIPSHRIRAARTLKNLGNSVLEDGRPREAEEIYRRYLGLLKKRVAEAPDNESALNDLAWALVSCPIPQARDPARAVELARKAIEKGPRKGTLWNTLGVAHYRTGDWRSTIEAMQKSIQLREGGDGIGWFFLAMAYCQIGDRIQARTSYDHAVEWTNKNAPKDVELKRFRAEAAELLGPTDLPADVFARP